MRFQNDNFVIGEIAPRCLLFVNTRNRLTDEEFGEVLKTFRDLGSNLSEYRSLAITDGAGPTAAQRKQQEREFGPIITRITTAVVSDAVTTRFIVSSAALFMRHIKSFDVRELPAALRFIGFAEGDAPGICQQLSTIPVGKFRTLDAILQRRA